MSEFGKGLSYCLGLFLAHAERERHASGYGEYTAWFNGAADHLYGLQIPAHYSAELKKRLEQFQKDCLHWRLNTATKENFQWAITEAKALLMAVDKENGIDVEEAEWS